MIANKDGPDIKDTPIKSVGEDFPEFRIIQLIKTEQQESYLINEKTAEIQETLLNKDESIAMDSHLRTRELARRDDKVTTSDDIKPVEGECHEFRLIQDIKVEKDERIPLDKEISSEETFVIDHVSQAETNKILRGVTEYHERNLAKKILRENSKSNTRLMQQCPQKNASPTHNVKNNDVELKTTHQKRPSILSKPTEAKKKKGAQDQTYP